ncbi:MAG: pyruvate dehydrogenase (acetyl-transferring) E1 component subunit alpha [Parachlamydiales bacterium]
MDKAKVVKELGKEGLSKILRQMLLIRNFEIRAEAAYQHGLVGGFLHLYIGQEAIATGAVEAIGVENWWITTYRCHAHALLLGATPKEIMAELFGRANGNAMGRGGSMHLYTDNLLGGFGIVGGQIPIAAGAAFAAKYLEQDRVAVCFLGDGAVAQGAFHESLNLAALWDLPLIVVIENNQWGMGTAVDRAISVKKIAEHFAPAYGLKGYTFDGMDFFTCYSAFKEMKDEVKKHRKPVLVEMMTQRFRGHSVSDPALYRKKEELHRLLERDPIHLLKEEMVAQKMLTEETFKEWDKEARAEVVEAVKYAEESPWPEVATLEEGVFAP